jgi:hypothetical protein
MTDSSDFVVRPLPSEFADVAYDLGFFVVGTEARSRHIAEKFAERTKSLVALRYPLRQVGSYVRNHRWAKANSCEIFDLGNYVIDEGRELFNIIQAKIRAIVPGEGLARVWIDVSSMDKALLARVLLCVYEICIAAQNKISISILYCPAFFVEPLYAFQPVRLITPAIPELSGSISLRSENASLIIGLGYEYGVALGIMQQAEPDGAYVFVPASPDKRYDDALQKANMGFDFGSEQVTLAKYLVENPATLFEQLFALTSDASRHQRYIIVPGGPKIFAACATLVAVKRRPWIPLLRVSLVPISGYAIADPSDRMVGMELMFTAPAVT